jgi:hypothetical protein
VVWVSTDNVFADWENQAVAIDKSPKSLDFFALRAQEAMNDAHAAVYPMDVSQLESAAITADVRTREELLAVIHRQGFEDVHQVRKCELEPNGTFYVEAFDPSAADKRHAELLARLDGLQVEIAQIRFATVPQGSTPVPSS